MAVKMKLADMQECFVRLSAKSPNPQTELEFSSPYTLLVAVMLSAQTTDKKVNQVTPKLFQHADTPEKMDNLKLEKVRDTIKEIGFQLLRIQDGLDVITDKMSVLRTKILEEIAI